MLLFSYSTRMLDLIGAMLTRAGYTFQRLDGATRQADRQKLVDTFNSSPSAVLFLISTGAGSLGLNLTGANKCAWVIDPRHKTQTLDHVIDPLIRACNKWCSCKVCCLHNA